MWWWVMRARNSCCWPDCSLSSLKLPALLTYPPDDSHRGIEIITFVLT
jgi:hypothetical protein